MIYASKGIKIIMITFKTSEDRMKHPQAKLIPEVLWNDKEFFAGSLYKNVLALMSTPQQELLPSLKLDLDSLKYKSKATLLAIALSHPDLALAELLNMAMELAIEQLDLFHLLILTENKKWIDAFMDVGLVPSLEEDIFSHYFWAAERGYALILEQLEAKEPEKTLTMIRKDSYRAYRLSAQNGFLEVLKHLESRASSEIPAMIEAENFYAYRRAAENDFSEVVLHLEQIAPAKIQEMIQADNFYAFRLSAKNNCLKLAQKMLFQSGACFAFAEDRGSEFDFIVSDFIKETLTQLRQTMLNTPKGEIFDIPDVERSKVCFYIMRALIRSNSSSTDENLRFLLKIPALRNLSFQEVTKSQPNELLRLASRAANAKAASLLLTIPEVKRLAEQNNYYPKEGQLDLALITPDFESLPTVSTRGPLNSPNESGSFFQTRTTAQGQYTSENAKSSNTFAL